MTDAVAVVARMLVAEGQRHAWEPFECRCSCGVVPAVVDQRHTFDVHVSEAQADAVIASGILRDPAAVKAETLREWIAEWPTAPGDGTFLQDVARAGLLRADALEDESERVAIMAMPANERPHYELHDGTCVICGEPWMCQRGETR